MLKWMKTRLNSLFRRDRLEHDLDRELSFHIDMLTEQNVRAGMSPADARSHAMQRFGAVEGVKDDVRDTWLSRVFETLGQDMRYGLRNLRRSPGFALVVIATMALGIGANTAIFSVVNGVLLRPLPYEGGERLVVLRQQRPLAGDNDIRFSPKEIADYGTQTAGLEGVAEFHSMWFILLGRSEPERVSTGVVSSNFFPLLGVKPMLGRDFRHDDEQLGAPAVLLLSHKYWQRSFGGDPSIVGRVFQMNDRPHEVIGVLPAVTEYPEEVDVYMPTSACPFRSSKRMVETRSARMMQAFGKIREKVTLEKARADIGIVASRLAQDHPQDYPANRGYQTIAIPLQEELTRSFKTTLLVLLGTAGFVLLIVCASIANLTLARMVRRQREMSVRAALGASRTRLLRQLLTESTLLAVIGGALGLMLATWGLDLLVLYAERFTSRAAEIQIDRTGTALHAPGFGDHRPGIRVGAGLCGASWLDALPRRRDEVDAGVPRPAQFVDRRAGGDVVHAADRRRPDRQDAHQPSTGRSRLPHRRHPDVAPRSEFHQVPGPLQGPRAVLGASR